MIHKNVLGYGLLHSGKRRWGLEDSSRGMPVTQPSDTTQVHHPSTQASLCKDILLPILETFGKAQERVCQVPGSHFDQNSKCRQYFFFSARQVAILRSHWGLRGYFYGGGKLVRFPQEDGKRCGSSQGGTGLASLSPFSRGGLEVTHHKKKVSWVCERVFSYIQI